MSPRAFRAASKGDKGDKGDKGGGYGGSTGAKPMDRAALAAKKQMVRALMLEMHLRDVRGQGPLPPLSDGAASLSINRLDGSKPHAPRVKTMPDIAIGSSKGSEHFQGEQLRMAITILGHLGPCNLANILERQTRHRAPELKLHHSRPCHQYHPIPPMYLCHACHLCHLCHLCLQPYP